MNALKCEIGGGTEQYLKPEMEIIEMKNDDVILTSCTGYCACNSRDDNEPDW